ncbi:tetratricopeptide repeat protein [Anaerotignum sp.]|uniref:tetratricopeptide repeat protein n=1 Tax=Anaerotignum sp. TaxID=2039241 RepID=UPI0028AC71B6|nr:tetratricopeptide repeat protein [Anaerotignum sp.]
MSFYLTEIRELRKDFMESYKGGDLKKALFLGKRLLNIYDRNEDKDSSGLAEDIHNVAVVFDELGFYERAVEYYRKAASLKKARCGESPSFANSLNNLAIAYSNLGLHEEALKTHKCVLAVRKTKLGKEHIDYIYTLYNLGNTYEALNQYDKALESHGQALELSCGCKALQMMDVADIHASMACCFEKKGNYKKAVFYYEFALDIIEKKRGVQSLQYISNALSLALVCEKAEYFGLAVEYCERVVEIRRKMFPKGHLDYVNNMEYLSSICRKDRQFDKSLKIHKSILELIEEKFGQTHLLYFDTLDKIALDYCGKKNFEKALSSARGCLTQRKDALLEDDLEITKSYMIIGQILDEIGNYSEALAYYEKALCIRENIKNDSDGALDNVWDKIAKLFEKQEAYEAAAFLYEFVLRIRNKCLSLKNENDISFFTTLVETREKQEEFIRAVVICFDMVVIAGKLYGKRHAKYSIALKHLGLAYQKAGDLAMAGKYLEEALNIQRDTLDEDNPIYIKTMDAFAEVCYQRGDCLRAIQLYKERNDVNFEETPEEQREAACTLLAIGNCYLKLGEYDKANAYLVESEDKIKRSRVKPDDRFNQLLEMYGNGIKGNFHVTKPARRRLRDGERRCLEETILFLLRYYRKIQNDGDQEKREKAFIAVSLGEMYQRLGKQEETVYWYTLAEKESQPEYYVRACTRLAEAYLTYGEDEKALQRFINGKEYMAEYGDIHSADYCLLLGHIGDCLYKKGDKEAALSFYNAWKQLYNELELPDCITYDNRIEKVCRLLTSSGRNKEVIEQYYALALSIRNREGETEKFAKILLRIAMLHINLGESKEAETLLDRVLILAGKSGITSEKFGKVCDRVGRLYSSAGLEEKAVEALKLAYNESSDGKKCITKEGMQLLRDLLWKNGDYEAYFSVKNGCEKE